jgi:plasmid stabilization system protein ParE
MEEGLPRKEIIISKRFIDSSQNIYDYGFVTFGYSQAEHYRINIIQAVSALSERYLMHPECRHLASKSRMYRNIILDAHLIIYRITETRIEVLNILHSASSITKIRQSRKITI